MSLNRSLDSDHAHERTAADGTCAARMTSVNVSQRMHELSDGMMRLFSATKAGWKRFILEIPAYMQWALELATPAEIKVIVDVARRAIAARDRETLKLPSIGVNTQGSAGNRSSSIIPTSKTLAAQ